MLKKELLKFIRPEPDFTYNIHDTRGLNLVTRLQLGPSHLDYNKFRHNLQDCASFMWVSSHEFKTTNHSSLCKEIPLSEDMSN